jgi:hypothetical protein
MKKTKFISRLQNEQGRVGYLIAWLLGVPVSLLFIIFLIRGH